MPQEQARRTGGKMKSNVRKRVQGQQASATKVVVVVIDSRRKRERGGEDHLLGFAEARMIETI